MPETNVGKPQKQKLMSRVARHDRLPGIPPLPAVHAVQPGLWRALANPGHAPGGIRQMLRISIKRP